MLKHTLNEDQIHDLTMFILNKFDIGVLDKNSGETSVEIFTDSTLEKYLLIANKIKSNKKQVKPSSFQI